MLGEAISRVAPLIPPCDCYVVTGAHLVDAVREACVGVPDENVLAEPFKRNTAGCLAYATACLMAEYAQSGCALSMAVLTADHVIGGDEAFRDTVAASMRAAEEHDVLAMIGVVPDRPETGYGYIQIGDTQPLLTGHLGGVAVHRVSRFHEKPELERAEEFVASGRYLWNAGMFFWTVPAFMAELEAANPQLAHAIQAMHTAMRDDDNVEVRRIFEGLEDIPIDRALMERANNVAVARAEFSWDDIGAWPALDRTFNHDGSGCVSMGNPLLIDCDGCIVYDDTERHGRDVAVAVVGAKDMVVVVTDDAVLVVPKDRAQDVKRAVAELRRRNALQL